MLSTDTILQSRYRILRPLGRGGMGAVYEAFDERLSRTVALKQTLVETDELQRAFAREARLLANLRHPALPKVLDHFSEGAGLFLVMEFIPGDDLGVMLQEGRSFAPAEVLRWADQILDALEYLHTLNPPVLHRDIKPSNLKLISAQQIVLLDFGLAKGAAGQMTLAGDKSVHGYSPSYSALEQIQGTGTDQRSDLYALGATLYHLLTGVKPPDALTRATALVNGQPDPLRPAREINAEVPPATSAALMRAMALNQEQRTQSAAEMRYDLHNMTTRAAATVPVFDRDETTVVSLPAETTATGPSSGRGRQVVIPVPEERRVAAGRGKAGWKWTILASAIAGFAILSIMLYFWYAGQKRPKPRTRSTQPVAKRNVSPSPSVSPTLPTNINQQPVNTSGPEAIGPAESAARAKLAQKNIPYTEESFTKVVENGDPDAVELFLAAGMNPDTRDATGRTALIRAAAQGRDDISQKLLSRGADVNAQDSSGSTALMEAATRDHQETLKVLLEKGADVDLVDGYGQTALLRAAAQGHSAIVRVLLNKGARVDIKDKGGRDALLWAEVNHHSDVADLLKKAGAR